MSPYAFAGPASEFAVHPEIAAALANGTPVVALESTIISHGLPAGRNLDVARQIEEAVRANGAVPATIALLDGRVHVGLTAAELERIALGGNVAKASVRDLAFVLARGLAGATTVASTALIAHLAGLRVFATGGLGGVHREAATTFDESADLAALAAAPITVVCAGCKSVLDVAATLERLETLSVGVVGYGTDVLPGFYIRETTHRLPWRADGPEEVVAIIHQRDLMGLPQALVVANPIPEASAMDAARHGALLAAALRAMEKEGVSGKDVTPFLLAYFHEHTHGESLEANIALVLNNAALAANIATALRCRA